MSLFARLTVALALPWLLSACLVTPGKFTSTLDIRKDRTFTFTYQGEVLAFDLPGEMAKGAKESGDDKKDSLEGTNSDIGLRDIGFTRTAERKTPQEPEAESPLKSETDPAKMRAIAEALSKEAGYRSARYVGANKFMIDYAITGRLDHAFVYPFNIDAQLVFPFIAVELRGQDKIRVKAPGYANSDDKTGGAGGASPDKNDALDGSFTLTTNARLLSQNQEDGATDTPAGKQVVWRVTPLTRDEPTAVLALDPLR